MSERRTHLISLVQKVKDGGLPEREIDALLDALEGEFPSVGVSDLIFYSEPSLTAAEVVDRAMQKKPILLGRG